MTDTTTSEEGLTILLATCRSIDARLARLEDLLSHYEPLLREVSRRMAGPASWLKGR